MGKRTKTKVEKLKLTEEELQHARKVADTKFKILRDGIIITQVMSPEGDWEILKLNGEVFFSGHSANVYDVVRGLKGLGIEISLVEEEVTDEEMEELC